VGYGLTAWLRLVPGGHVHVMRGLLPGLVHHLIEADAATGDYPHTLTVRWWWLAAEGVTVEVRCTLTHHSATSLVRYTLDNPPRNHGRQHPEDRRWAVSWTLGSGSASIKWWTSPGNKPRMTWTWPPGTSLNHAVNP
jgi:hypothetical protein